MLRLIRVRSGSARTVYALEVNGRCETYELLRSLPERAEQRLGYIFERLAETGWAGKGVESVRHLRGPVYELKEHSSNVRLYCFFHAGRVVCTHGSAKRSGKARLNQEIDKVVRLYDLCVMEDVLV
jgi:phage-related protein